MNNKEILRPGLYEFKLNVDMIDGTNIQRTFVYKLEEEIPLSELVIQFNSLQI